jgi:hypothetical protein
MRQGNLFYYFVLGREKFTLSFYSFFTFPHQKFHIESLKKFWNYLLVRQVFPKFLFPYLHVKTNHEPKSVLLYKIKQDEMSYKWRLAVTFIFK